ncbi:hypothetical protein [Mycobacterium attenuatum]|uniref:Uncharacterized protein n=1 Tax=Mycobacterium attenuatum TaxID=2341086 RepID=A0A498QEM2_9MYCO|nr:hypothetical protein [Mycobacterium attenuatum]VBA43857.1 hypothetical protein LAUMK136_05330 [Mycobacterium attenuatum]VBA59997.1 hypothetical protein LAUMK191_05308 [Mycobacterium attenuatum]VBA62083.1 hypothetical protein LAUMK41_05470 [Mycobacterium attenuatum]
MISQATEWCLCPHWAARLHRGGDRVDISGLHIATVVRLRYDPHSQAYVDRRISESLSMPEIIRCQKR